MKSHIFYKILLLIIIQFFSGCLTFENPLDETSTDSIIQRAEPYISKIVQNDIELRAYANSIIGSCSTNDKECQINAIYRHIVENYNYLSDPKDIELIQTPQETILIKGGDCEDLTILLNSLLENIGIETYLVLTDTHVYSLAHNIDPDRLWIFVEESLISQVEEDWGDVIEQNYKQTFVLEGNHNWYYGFDGSTFENTYIDYMDIIYDIESNEPLHFYIVPSSNDFDLLNEGKTFYQYSDYKEENVLTITGVCPYLDQKGGIILCNKNWNDAIISVNLTFYFHPSFYKLFKNETILTYTRGDENFLVLDPTAGDYGHPGYDGGLTEKKIAINPSTKEYFYL